MQILNNVKKRHETSYLKTENVRKFISTILLLKFVARFITHTRISFCAAVPLSHEAPSCNSVAAAEKVSLPEQKGSSRSHTRKNTVLGPEVVPIGLGLDPDAGKHKE